MNSEQNTKHGGVIGSIGGGQANKTGRGQMAGVTCAYCRGEGRIRTGAICQVCKGKGYRRLHEPTAPCSSCRGTGRVERNSSLACVACGGLGTVTVAAAGETVPCPDCGGSGRAVDCPDYPWPDSALNCVRCLGTGVIDRAKLKSDDPPPGVHKGSAAKHSRKATFAGTRGITLEY